MSLVLLLPFCARNISYFVYFVHKWHNVCPEFTVKCTVVCKSLVKMDRLRVWRGRERERGKEMRRKEDGFAALRYSPLISF